MPANNVKVEIIIDNKQKNSYQQMKLDLANQRMLLVVWLLALTLVALCFNLVALFWLLAIQPLVAKSVCAELNLTRTGMDLHTIQLI